MRKTLTQRLLQGLLLGFLVLGPAIRSPAPLIYRPGSGWEFGGEGELEANSKAQLEKGLRLEKEKDWDNAAKAFYSLVKTWPLSPNAAEAQFHFAHCLVELGDSARAFKEYQKTLEQYPDSSHFNDILKEEYEIGNMFLNGERLKVFYIPTFPSMDKAVEIYEAVLKNGPYSEIAPLAQMKIGFAREKQKKYKEAVEAYENLIRKYPKSDLLDDAQFQIGFAYMKAAREADYDQTATNRAITAFQDYLTRYPKSEKAEQAMANIKNLQGEQAQGLYNIARYYDRKDNPTSALIYYNEVIQKYPETDLAKRSKERVNELDIPVDTQKVPTAPVAKADDEGSPGAGEQKMEGSPPDPAPQETKSPEPDSSSSQDSESKNPDEVS